MRHVADGILRRLDDEPLAIPDRITDHLAGCPRCRARQTEIAGDADRVAHMLSGAAVPPPPDPDLAWLRLRRELARADPPARARARVRHAPRAGRRPRLPQVSLRAGLAAGLTGAVIAATAGAATLTTIFDPTHVAPVALDRSDLQAIADLTGLGGGSALGGLTGPSGSMALKIGRLSWSSAGKAAPAASAAAASARTGLAVTLPAHLPSGVTSAPRFLTQPRMTATITFGRSASALAGTSVSLRGGPAVVVGYPGSIGRDVPVLGIATMPRPTAVSTGAGLARIEAFLLGQPGIPAGLAEEVRLLGDVGTVLPVPVPSGAQARSVRIGPWPGVLVTDASRVAAAVVWEDGHGLVHAVAGLLDPQDILHVARQLG
jgi:hypothetical protein